MIGVTVVKAEPGRPRESSDRENKIKPDPRPENEIAGTSEMGAGMRGLLSPLP